MKLKFQWKSSTSREGMYYVNPGSNAPAETLDYYMTQWWLLLFVFIVSVCVYFTEEDKSDIISTCLPSLQHVHTLVAYCQTLRRWCRYVLKIIMLQQSSYVLLHSSWNIFVLPHPLILSVQFFNIEYQYFLRLYFAVVTLFVIVTGLLQKKWLRLRLRLCLVAYFHHIFVLIL